MDTHLKSCHCCGLIQRLPVLAAGEVAACFRCDSTLHQPTDGRRNAARTAALALGALLLFFPAILLPILEIEKLGHRYHSSILTGIFQLFRHGNWFVGGIVFVFSILFPMLKLTMLIDLSVLKLTARKHRAITYRLMEHAGRWSMMDVLLLAFMVMLVKIGELVQFRFGPAVVAFVLCVVMSMLASMAFDPHAIWEEE